MVSHDGICNFVNEKQNVGLCMDCVSILSFFGLFCDSYVNGIINGLIIWLFCGLLS